MSTPTEPSNPFGPPPVTCDFQPVKESKKECFEKFDPTNGNVTPRKVATVAAAVLLTCILALTACILISQYPAASSAFITTFSILGIGSLITLSIALCKHYKKPSASLIRN